VNPRHAAALALVGWYLIVPPMTYASFARQQKAPAPFGSRGLSPHIPGLGDQRFIAERTIASTVKSVLPTAPILMYQHSRSGAFGVGRSQKLDIPF
jgi:hypothetical protein